MIKICPICDTQINGRFCKICKRFVTPVEFKGSMHLNSGHDDFDPDCDYHGNTSDYDILYHGTDIDKCETPSYKLSSEPNNTNNTNQAKSSMGCLVVFLIASLISFIAFFSEKSKEQNTIPDDPFWVSDPIDNSELNKLRADGGFDENGFKNLTTEEVLKEKLESNWTSHFGESNISTMKHLVSELEKHDNLFWLEAESNDSNDSNDSFQYMDDFGEVWNYFINYNYIYFYENQDYSTMNGYISVISDIYTGQTDEIDITSANDTELLKKLTAISLLTVSDYLDSYDFLYDLIDDSIEQGETELFYNDFYITFSPNETSGDVDFYTADIRINY